MPKQYLIPLPAEQDLPYEAADIAQGVGIQLATFLFPLLVVLDRMLDKRLVRTFLSSIQLIIAFRDRVHGLLLSEMGGYLLSAEHERAGPNGWRICCAPPSGQAGSLTSFSGSLPPVLCGIWSSKSNPSMLSGTKVCGKNQKV